MKFISPMQIINRLQKHRFNGLRPNFNWSLDFLGDANLKRIASWQNRQRIKRLARQVAAHDTQPSHNLKATAEKDSSYKLGQMTVASKAKQGAKHFSGPVIVLNVSSRLTGLSLNAAFSMLTAWGLRLAGAPVVHFVCQAGLSPCVLGTNRQDFSKPPPCQACIKQSKLLFHKANVHWFSYHPDPDLEEAIRDLSIADLSEFEYPLHSISISESPATLGRMTVAQHYQSSDKLGRPRFFRDQMTLDRSKIMVPLGTLVLPSIRWALRRHNLPDDSQTRYLLRSYIFSAYSVAREFARLIEETNPSAAVIFNGVMYPEASARWIAQQFGVRVVTHEVGFQRLSAFFTDGQATAYPIHIPSDFELNPHQDVQLDTYLEDRFQGKFTMAGIRFWPEMHGLDEEFLQKAQRSFKQIVPIFTNVVYDTSQLHANVIFPHMFAWLDLVRNFIQSHPETLFVIRAHPDEMRPDSAKISNESVHDWVKNNRVDELPNVVFIDSREYISSYELIQRSKFVMVYNSSIGLEAALMGKVVLCAGRARYTQYPIVFFPDNIDTYSELAQQFLSSPQINFPEEFRRNARRFLYYQLYRVSLPMDDYLEVAPRQGFTLLKPISWTDLLAENSTTMQVLINGILESSLDIKSQRHMSETVTERPVPAIPNIGRDKEEPLQYLHSELFMMPE